MLEESSGGDEEMTPSTSVLVVHDDEILSWDRKNFSDGKDMKSIVDASSI